MERNDAVFNDIKWPRGKLLQKIWLGLIDYGHLSWDIALRGDQIKFRNLWCRNDLFAEWVVDRPRWKLVGPSNGFDVH
jgi:hypothetical protein